MYRLIAAAGLLTLGCSTTRIDDGDTSGEESGFGFREVASDLPLVVAEHPPPPIAGGTLAAQGGIALVGDPDRLRILVVGLGDESVKPIPVEGQPGRALIAGNSGYVLLRDRGKLLTIDLEAAEVIAETDVCAAPRGIAQHPDGALRVSCLGGALLKVTDTEVLTIARLEADLRDVIVVDGTTYVSWFRSAVVGEVDDDGNVTRRFRPEEIQRDRRRHLPSVVWRMMPAPNGKIAVVHQTTAPGEVPVSEPGGYGGGGRFGCDGISGVGVSQIDPKTGRVDTIQLEQVVLPVDLAVRPSGGSFGFMVPAAGNGRFDGYASIIPEFGRQEFAIDDACQIGTIRDPEGGREALGGQFTAVATDPTTHLYVALQREPAQLRLVDFGGSIIKDIPLGGETVADTGMTLFHRDAGGGIACASCHPEGGDDGFAWTFEGVDGVRRTQMLRGGIKGTEPFHWEGDLADFAELADEVFSHRMGGPLLTGQHHQLFIDYIDRMPDVHIDGSAVDAVMDATVARGKALFDSAETGCSACHLGGPGSDNRSHDVGTGGRFQTPALRGLAQRLPLMHTGCAKTISSRFEAECGGGDAHGKTSHLTAAEIADLTRYLGSL